MSRLIPINRHFAVFSVLAISCVLTACHCSIVEFKIGFCGGHPCFVFKMECDTDPISALQSVNAASLLNTREVDPGIFADDPNGIQNGTLTITLNNGSMVHYSSALSYDAGASVPPHRPGWDTLVYRPAHPNQLQSFIDQYENQATGFKLVTRVGLNRIGGEDDEWTPIDTQTKVNGDLSYGGGVVTRPGNFGPLNKRQ